MNTRDMEDSKSRVCFAALIAHGGGEYSANQAIAAGIEACVRRDTPAGRAALEDARNAE
ncbi:hypothetical protein [Ancylobacter oerskovii]|nr:hypothetical protein [Ancylobacter oerskovii]MBS7542556.1 hypothetical protein [Ancylobacter oerskovii]